MTPGESVEATPADSAEPMVEEKSGSADSYLGLAQPSNGFQMRSVGADIGPGVDVEYCEVAELPGTPEDKYFVWAVEVANAPYSHHVLVESAIPDSASSARLRELPIGTKVPCAGAPSVFGEDMERIAGAQQSYAKRSYSPGVGRIYQGGQRIVFDYHYLNLTDEVIQARSAINFHLTDEASIQHVAHLFSFVNVAFEVPPGTARGVMSDCRFNQDIYLERVTRHTHRWGTDYSIWRAGGANDGELFWRSGDWENTDHVFEPMLILAGEGFRFECNYENTESYTLRYGLKATDEMCMMLGTWWPAGDGDANDQNCFITQIGDDGVGRAAR